MTDPTPVPGAPSGEMREVRRRLRSAAGAFGTVHCPCVMTQDGRLVANVYVEEMRTLLDDADRLLASLDAEAVVDAAALATPSAPVPAVDEMRAQYERLLGEYADQYVAEFNANIRDLPLAREYLAEKRAALDAFVSPLLAAVPVEPDMIRMDWLEAQTHCEVNRMGTTVPYWLVQTSNPARWGGNAPTLREAIDAAIGTPVPSSTTEQATQ